MSSDRPVGSPGDDAWGSGTSAPRFEDQSTIPLGHALQGSGQGPDSYWQPPQSSSAVLPAALPATRAKPHGVSRRKVLVGAGAGMLGIGALGAGLGVFLANRASGPADVFTHDAGQIAHILRRAGFGPSPSDIGDYLNLGVQGTIDRLINYSSVANDDLDKRISALNLDLTNLDDLIRSWVLRMIYTQRPLEEKMTLFWHGVLTSSILKVGGKKGYPLMAQQNQLLRAKAMGRFDDLIHAVSTDPAMLHWLDGNRSTGRNPNENYARELMELFTLGVTNSAGQPNYTQDDVHQGALALTGWRIQNGKGVYAPAQHYNGSVTFLGHTGNFGLNDVVRLVCAHPSTGYHIAWRMWSFFVSENPSANDLKPVADAYYQSNHSISAMVKTMFASPAFLSANAYRSRVKSPVEFIAGAVRGLGLDTELKGVSLAFQQMGQVPFDPPNVSGWDGDKVSASWVSTGAWMTRVNLVNLLLAGASGVTVKGGAQARGSANTANSALQRLITARQVSTPHAVADYFVAALADNQLDADRRAMLYDAVSQRATGPSFALAGNATVPAASVRNTLYLLMSMPEYQMN